SALKASGANDLSIDDVRTWHYKIQGTRKTKKAAPVPSSTVDASAPPVKKSVSSSQQSFDKIIEHFERLIGALKNEPLYAPNENEMKIATLQALLKDMKTNNDAVISARIASKSDNGNRDNVLYADGTGLVSIAQAVKAYTHSIFGSNTRE